MADDTHRGIGGLVYRPLTMQTVDIADAGVWRINIVGGSNGSKILAGNSTAIYHHRQYCRTNWQLVGVGGLCGGGTVVLIVQLCEFVNNTSSLGLGVGCLAVAEQANLVIERVCACSVQW